MVTGAERMHARCGVWACWFLREGALSALAGGSGPEAGARRNRAETEAVFCRRQSVMERVPAGSDQGDDGVMM